MEKVLFLLYLPLSQREEFRGFPNAGDQYAEGSPEGVESGPADLGGGISHRVKSVVRWRETLPVPEEPAPVAFQHVPHPFSGQKRIPEGVVIEDAGQVGPGREEGLERPLHGLLERSPIDLVLHPGRERHLAEGARELPVFFGRRGISQNLNPAWVAAAQAPVVGETDVFDRKRIHPHHPGSYRIDGDLVRARKDDVFGIGYHASGTGPVSGECAVHYREYAGMNFLLDHQEVHEGLVNNRMGPVAPFVEEAAEGIFHGAGCGGKYVGLHGGQVDDVFADQAPGNVESVGVDLIQAQESVRQIAHGIPNVDPFLAFIQVDIPQAVGVDDLDLFILPFAQPGIDDDRPVVAGVDQVPAIAVPCHGADHAFELPRGRGTAGVEKMPGNIDFQGGVELPVQDVLVPRQVQEPVVVFQDRLRSGFKYGDTALHNTRFRVAAESGSAC